VQLINDKKYTELQELHNAFGKIHGKDHKNKLILLSNYFRFQTTNDKEKRAEYAEKVLESLKKFDQDTFSYYFEKIKDSLEQYKKLEKKLQPELNPSMSFLEALFFLPTRMMANVYNAFIAPQKQNTDDE